MGKYRVPNHTLFTGPWWAGTWRRVAWTALATVVALLLAGGISQSPEQMAAAGITVALAALAALLTALVRLPEVDGGGVPLWQASLARTARTVAQVLLAAGAGSAVALGDVDWQVAWQTAATAALVTLIRTAMTALGPVDDLPEVSR